MRSCSSQYCGTVVSDRSTLLGMTAGSTKSITERRSAIM